MIRIMFGVLLLVLAALNVLGALMDPKVSGSGRVVVAVSFLVLGVIGVLLIISGVRSRRKSLTEPTRRTPEQPKPYIAPTHAEPKASSRNGTRDSSALFPPPRGIRIDAKELRRLTARGARCVSCGCSGKVVNSPDWPERFRQSSHWASPTSLVYCDALGGMQGRTCGAIVCLRCAYTTGKSGARTFQCPNCGFIIPVHRDAEIISRLF
jgi:hypothetical protein